MNDADLGDNIEQRVAQSEQAKAQRDKRFQNDDAHLDPRLIIVNAIQLAIAIVSNVFLLLNMARRVRFSLAQPITIVGWYLSAICLIALNATASGPLVIEPREEYINSQAFYYGMFAAILYFVTASLMVVTVYGAYTRHYAEDFQLTTAQRTLMLQTILFLLYLLLGALVFSTIEDWSYLDAVYWADVTLFTVGFGDFAAASPLGRALLIPYALVGVISLGLVIGSIRSLVLERGRRRLDARMVEKKRRQLIRTMTRKGKDDILKPIPSNVESPISDASPLPATEFERRQEEFNLMRKIQDSASVRRRWMAMSISFSSWLILWLVGAKIFQECERPYQNWSYFEGFYFAFVTLTTIGYGDRTPVSNSGKAFFVFWSLLALPTMTVMISNAGDTVVKAVRDATLELGNVTILPGERGFRKELLALLDQWTCGVIFKGPLMDEEDELPPGFLGNAHQLEQGSSEEDDNDTDAYSSVPDPTSGRQQSRSRDPTAPLPSSRAEYHFLLISEIAAVRQHSKQKPAKKYSFAEWAWYLKLIGEDESSSATHRKARPHIHSKKKKSRRRKMGDEDMECPDEDKWSWVGSQSPLMGSLEECEWIIEKLTEKLRDELDVVRGESSSSDVRGEKDDGDEIM
ncbi:hypothetical protein K4K57_002787 [Colletotrichum sp. SAR 10_99]|nr:hypothetical protein K4K55_011582 [Colletotrichum sp. SAR 10_96]KAJ5013445.1 hypothetical protein K4K57_002787 [Colletotrichum sp. SAR 10_99]